MVNTRQNSRETMLDQESQNFITNAISSQISPVAAQLAALIKRLDEQSARIEQLEADSSLKDERISSLEKQLETSAAHLSESVDDVQQYTRRYSLRINGLAAPSTNEGQEDVLKVVEDCCVKMDVAYDPSSIDRAHRVGPVITDSRTQRKSQSVIVKFRHWSARRAIYAKRPRFNNTGNKPGFKIAVDLTKRRHQLLARAIEEVKNYPDIDFACTDLNCYLKLKAGNDWYFFNNDNELNNILKGYKSL